MQFVIEKFLTGRVSASGVFILNLALGGESISAPILWRPRATFLGMGNVSLAVAYMSFTF
jgi:hypothetical protein